MLTELDQFSLREERLITPVEDSVTRAVAILRVGQMDCGILSQHATVGIKHSSCGEKGHLHGPFAFLLFCDFRVNLSTFHILYCCNHKLEVRLSRYIK